MPVRESKAPAKAPKTAKKGTPLELIPLGGLGEIGLNCMAMAYDGEIIVVDVGFMFPNATQPGVEAIVPDFSFLKENRDGLRGVILTHGHEDHIGALSFLARECPGLDVYGTPLTLALASHRLQENSQEKSVNQHPVQAGDRLELGPFQIEFIRVSHSILDSVGLAITTPAGVVVHTGDFKLDGSAPEGERLDIFKFSEYGEKGVLALLCDSTNSDVPGYSTSERDVGASLQAIFQKTNGRVILTCFASSIARIREIANACHLTGRRMVLDGRSMVSNVKLAAKLGYLDIPPELAASAEQAEKLPPERVCVVLTGSQGEPLSALARLAAGEHRKLKAGQGDTIIFSARAIPGNDTAINALVNQFLALGAEVMDPSTHLVHASGHGHQEELKLMHALVRPLFLVPVHGELHHLRSHARLAKSQGLPHGRAIVLRNGQRLILHKDGTATLGQQVKSGRLLVDGIGLGPASDPVIKERRRLSEQGIVTVTLALDPLCGTLLSPPQVSIQGLLYEGERDLKPILEARISDAVSQEPLPLPREGEKLFLSFLDDLVKREAKGVIRAFVGRRPVIQVHALLLPGLAPAPKPKRPARALGKLE